MNDDVRARLQDMAVPDTANPAIRAALQGYAAIGEQVKLRIAAFADYPVEVRRK